jgi:hypothetical protein
MMHANLHVVVLHVHVTLSGSRTASLGAFMTQRDYARVLISRYIFDRSVSNRYIVGTQCTQHDQCLHGTPCHPN